MCERDTYEHVLVFIRNTIRNEENHPRSGQGNRRNTAGVCLYGKEKKYIDNISHVNGTSRTHADRVEHLTGLLLDLKLS